MRRLWAVARQTFLECLRSRVAAVVMIIMLVTLLGLGLFMQDSATLKGRIQTFMAYSSGLLQILLAAMTVLVGSKVVSEDVKSKTVFLLASKPLARWQYMLGRWLGLVMLNAMLIGGSYIAIYALVQYIRSCPTDVETRIARGEGLSKDEDDDRRAIDNELLTARVARSPEPIDIEAEVQATVERLQAEGGMEDAIRREIEARLLAMNPKAAVDPNQVRQQMQDTGLRQLLLQKITNDIRKRVFEGRLVIPPGQGLRLEFAHLPKIADSQTLQMIYRLHPTHANEDENAQTAWLARDPAVDGNVIMWPRRTDPIKIPVTLDIPGRAIAPDGRLQIQYVNLQGDTDMKLKLEEISVMCPSGSFEANLARGALLTLAGMCFWAALAVMFAGFLSFEIACMACFLFVGVGYASGFLIESTRLPSYMTPSNWQYISHWLVSAVTFPLPSFSDVSPTDRLVEGLTIDWTSVLSELAIWVRPAEPGSFWSNLGFQPAFGCGLKTAIALLLGCVIYQRRELARVQV